MLVSRHRLLGRDRTARRVNPRRPLGGGHGLRPPSPAPERDNSDDEDDHSVEDDSDDDESGWDDDDDPEENEDPDDGDVEEDDSAWDVSHEDDEWKSRSPRQTTSSCAGAGLRPAPVSL